jgi:hypothetical protein
LGNVESWLYGNPPAGFQANASSTWNSIGLYDLESESYLNRTGGGEFGTDVLSINGGNGSSTGDGVSLAGEIIGAVASKDFLLGYFGLSLQPSAFTSAANAKLPTLQKLFQNKLIPSVSFGYTAGAYYGDSESSDLHFILQDDINFWKARSKLMVPLLLAVTTLHGSKQTSHCH